MQVHNPSLPFATDWAAGKAAADVVLSQPERTLCFQIRAMDALASISRYL